MRRRLLTLAAGVSAVLFLATVMLCVWSWSTDDSVQWRRIRDSMLPVAGSTVNSAQRRQVEGSTIEVWALQTAAGQVGLRGTRYGGARIPAGSEWSWASTPRGRVPPRWASQVSQGSIPLWHLMVYTGVLPLWWVVRRYYSTLTRRRRLGLCPACGYDLRATPDRCPECGAVAAATSSPS